MNGGSETSALARGLFALRRIVVVGASRRAGTVGRAVLDNVMAGKPDMPVFAINPKVPKRAKTGADVQWLASLDDLPADTVDLAVVAVPAEKVPEAVAALGKKGVGLAVVISAGLKLGDDSPGADMMAAARAHGVRIIGPNCLGVLVPRAGINASFSHMGAREGGIALISQSGACSPSVPMRQECGIEQRRVLVSS